MKNLKRAFSTVACMDKNPEELISLCKKYNLSGIEIRIGENGSIAGCIGEKGLSELKNKFLNNKITITNLGSSACINCYDENVINTAKRDINSACCVGATAVRLFSGVFEADRKKNHVVSDYNAMLKAFSEIADYAKEKGVEVWIETHNDFSAGKVLKGFLDALDCKNIKIIWDIIHTIELNETIYDTWNYIGNRIAHVHIKDGYRDVESKSSDYCYTCLGEGELPVSKILDLLDEKDYEGFISFEWERMWRKELKKYPDDIDFVLTQYNDFLNRL